MAHHHHHGHHHAPDRASSTRALGFALAMTVLLAAVEAVGGVLTGSLALLADAGHMVSDAASLALALVAVALARRPATPQRSFGLQRAEILAALANGVGLVLIAGLILWEAVGRLGQPGEVLAGPMLGVAAAGLAVNLASALVLARGAEESLNRSAALRHVVADALGSVGAIVAALVILTTGWRYADPLVSMLIAALVLASSRSILRDSLRVLLEEAPPGIDVEEVGRRMVGVEGVREVHDLHVWTITSGFPALAAHVLVGAGCDCHETRRVLEGMLHGEFAIEHTTLQMDHEAESELLSIETRARASA